MHAAGESTTPIFLRSSAKPFQALAFIERGGQVMFKLSRQEIAIMCASHSGTSVHAGVLEDLHGRIGLQENMLQCGMHIPYDRTTAERMLKNGEALRPFHSDCSGKHTAMLAFAKMIGASLDDYLDLQHPVQQHILQTFCEMCGVNIEDLIFGIDGCSAPVFAIPLPNAARGYARLCHPDDLAHDRAQACSTITKSMVEHPDMVAGPDCFDTEFMHVMNGKAISKIGAEGYLAAGIFPMANPRNNGSVGICIKIADGDKVSRASSVVLLAVLDQLGILSAREKEQLAKYYIRPVRNWRGNEIGEIRPSRELLDFLSAISHA